MPQTRHISKEQPSPEIANSSNHFDFPLDNHLLITTPSQIVAWDSSGIQSIFKSSKHGIVAAREAKDGSGVLAVADKQVVVLHDTKRGQEKSWGLEADDDEVRHLEYTTDGKSLFLSTNLTADIQRYSTERARLVSPAKAHASPPVALAVSSTGHLMVSASDGPPVVYLKNLAHNSSPVLVEPRASKAAVSVIAFHPERPNIFLLAFKDGAIAAYDATKILRGQNGSISNQENVNKGEISHITTLHRASSAGTKRAAITGAAFMPGFKSRAVSVGNDGRCRLVEFADGGAVLRTWHAKAPVTSVSVLSMKARAENRNHSGGSRGSYIIGGPTSTNNIIAIGRMDGDVHLYDSVGLLLSHKSIGDEEKIISVEWAKAKSPNSVAGEQMSANTHPLPIVSLGENKGEAVIAEAGPVSTSKPRRVSTTFEHVGLPPDLRRPKPSPANGQPIAPRMFTIHPDEVDEGTVRHTPLGTSPKPASPIKGEYLDLFSPVKPPEPNSDMSPQKRVSSPPRARPQISSQTFVKSPDPTTGAEQSAVAKPRNLALFPSTDSGSETARASAKKAIKSNAIRQSATDVSPGTQKKRITFKATSARRRSRKSMNFKTVQAQPNNNAKILADIRRMNQVQLAPQSAGTLAAYSFDKPKPSSAGPVLAVKDIKPKNIFRRGTNHIETELDSDIARRAYEHAHVRQNWPEDSNQDSSLDGDIWLTSDSDETAKRSRKRRQHPTERPPARQTSRSRVDSKGTMSTTAKQPAVPPATLPPGHRFDGSTDEEMYTADTHMSADGTFSPSSQAIQELFPRSSSLSPRKHRISPKKRVHDQITSVPPKDQNLREITPNRATERQVKSPWARARAGKLAQNLANAPKNGALNEPVQIFENRPADKDGTDGVEPHCRICLPAQASVQNLEVEVARLKGEVLLLKTMLRRHGLPLPASLRPR